jgi:hypothetical protein
MKVKENKEIFNKLKKIAKKYDHSIVKHEKK